MTADIITIGDEILIGQIVDSNSAFISKELNKIGIDVRQITSIADEKTHILSSLKNAAEKSEIVIVTGGLGPTRDDITKGTICEYFNDTLVLCEPALKNIEKIFEKHDSAALSELNRGQAMLPSRADILLNKIGTASGIWFDENDIVYVFLPGVPFEMKDLLTAQVLPRLQQRFDRPFIVHKTVLTYGVGESLIADKIEKWEDALPSFIKLAYLPGWGTVRLRLSGRGKDEAILKNSIEAEIVSLYEFIGEYIKGYEDEDPMEVQIAKLLISRKETLASAESCTGGQISTKFTENPGASDCYKGGIVGYATEAKMDILNIQKSLIDKFSVVSAEVATEMARNARKMFKTDYALATTGNAGPTKGESDAEIGTVFIALASREGVEVFEFNFGNHRKKVVNKAVNKSLEILLDRLV